MAPPLQALRNVLEHELAVYGPYVPLDDPSAPSSHPVAPTPADVDPAAPDTDAAASLAEEPRPRLVETSPTAPTKQTPPAAPETPPFQVHWTPPVARQPTPSVSTQASADAMANFDLFGQELDPSQDPARPFWERMQALVPAESPLSTMQSLDEIKAYVDTTVLVPIDEARLHAVLGVGNPDADLVIIGEAPGADEDRTGEPFTGRAGQLLNKILAAINLKREDVYITNILKSRPPNNRDPVPAEVEAHIPILYKQLALIKPQIILCVGKTAGNALLQRHSSLGALRDKFHDFFGIPLMVTYHPAALLRNPQWKRPTWEDMKLLRTRYDQLVQG